jgi:hypothetical protein
MRQVVDWKAAVWAGVISGILFLILNSALTGFTLGSPWVYSRLIASVIMGSGVMPPPVTFDAGIFAVALVVNFVLSVAFACLLAVIIHRWGLVVGLLGGAVFGLALYLINFYTLSYFFPWVYPFRSWMMLTSHVLFGAAAGSIYELLEVEEFVPVREAE